MDTNVQRYNNTGIWLVVNITRGACYNINAVTAITILYEHDGYNIVTTIK